MELLKIVEWLLKVVGGCCMLVKVVGSYSMLKVVGGWLMLFNDVVGGC